jgi:hypothetical protein
MGVVDERKPSIPASPATLIGANYSAGAEEVALMPDQNRS